MIKRIRNAIAIIHDDNGALINELIKLGLAKKETVVEVVLDLDDPRYMYLVGRYIHGVDTNVLERRVKELKSAKYMYKFAKYIEGVNKEELASLVIEKNDAKYIFKFAKYMGDVLEIEKFAKGISKTKDSDYIYKFAMEIKNVPLNILVNGIIASNSVRHMYYFIRDLNLDKELRAKLMEAIILSRNLDIMCKLILEGNEYSSYLLKVVIDSKNISYIKYLIENTKDFALKQLIIKEYENFIHKNIINDLSDEAKKL